MPRRGGRERGGTTSSTAPSTSTAPEAGPGALEQQRSHGMPAMPRDSRPERVQCPHRLGQTRRGPVEGPLAGLGVRSISTMPNPAHCGDHQPVEPVGHGGQRWDTPRCRRRPPGARSPKPPLSVSNATPAARRCGPRARRRSPRRTRQDLRPGGDGSGAELSVAGRIVPPTAGAGARPGGSGTGTSRRCRRPSRIAPSPTAATGSSWVPAAVRARGAGRDVVVDGQALGRV